MKTKWKIIAALLALVFVSASLGAVVGARWMERTLQQRNTPEAWNQRALRALRQRLKPTPQQDLKIQQIIDRGIEEMTAIRVDTIARTDAVVESMLGELDREITPEQRPEFEKLRRQRGSTTLEMLKVEPRKK